MLSFLPSPLKGALSFMIYLINTILLTIPLILVSLLKFILPFQPVVVILDRILMGIAGLWIYINSVTTDLFCKIDWDIRGLDKLNPKQWYLVLSNHQSWVDILVLQKTLRKKSPCSNFPEKGADLGSVSGAGLVGPGFPLYEAVFQRILGPKPTSERKRPGKHPESVPEIQTYPGVYHEFCGRHSLHT